MRGIRFLTIFLAIIACEDVVEVEVPTDSPRLVLDAVTRIDDISRPTTNFQLSAHLSASFFGELQPAQLDGATLWNEATDTTIILREASTGTGIYGNTFDTAFLLEGNLVLTVVHGGQTYTAQTQFVPSVPIESLSQGEGNLFGGDETEVVVSFIDADGRDDFYLFDFDFNEYLVTEDEFYPGQRFEFSYFYDDGVEPGMEVEISLLGIDQAFFNYMNQVIVQADSGSQGPFQTPAATVKGNFVNTANPENFALGYFAVCETFKSTIFIE